MVLAGRRADALAAARDASGHREHALCVPTDVTSSSDVRRLFARTREAFGRIDLLFNNAGIPGTPRPVESICEAEWDEVVATNLTGSFLCAQQAFAMMKSQDPQGGRIINNGSVAAHTPRPFWLAYTATKHAVTGLTKSLGLEGRPYGIAVSQIDIGNARTAIADGIAAGTYQADGSVEAEPTIEASDVARVVLTIANLPLAASVPSVIVMATGMPFLGRG